MFDILFHSTDFVTIFPVVEVTVVTNKLVY